MKLKPWVSFKKEPKKLANDISRKAAQKAAREAAQQFRSEFKVQREPGSGSGVFALYLWGSIAVASAVFAAANGLLFTGSTGENPRKIAADNSTDNSIKKADLADNATNEAGSPEFERLVTAVEQNNLPYDPQTTGAIETTSAPVSESVSLAPEQKHSGTFAADIGGAKDLSTLSLQYSAMKRRAPDLFASLEPRVTAGQSGQLDNQRLIAGPFASQEHVANFCRSVKLQLTIECDVTSYRGVPIPSINQ